MPKGLGEPNQRPLFKSVHNNTVADQTPPQSGIEPTT
jgi:hypothetical protein